MGAKKILIKYGILIELSFNNVEDIYAQIKYKKCELSMGEHKILFDFFWSEFLKKEGKKISVSEGLKEKIIKNIGKFSQGNIFDFLNIQIYDLIEMCGLSTEGTELWSIWHTLKPKYAMRDCYSINEQIGIFKFVNKLLMPIIGKKQIKILDIGSGHNGTGLVTLSEKHPHRIAGYGVSLAVKKKFPVKDVHLFKADVLHMPFKDELFDFAYACHVIPYIKDKNLILAMNEILRVLKPGGCLLFNEHKRQIRDYLNWVSPGLKYKTKIKKRFLIDKKVIVIYKKKN